ncbi:hypothetical protein QOZ80_1BG0050830 [Eleusine coracana subsp. coracana]|nr:hypothetical protein QOZ80_1BG0050830 [Eleusine coracana subsp. coracana]
MLEKEARPKSPAAGDPASSVCADETKKKKKRTSEEKAAARKFAAALYEDAKQYAAMSEDEVEDEYRRAGKLHVYDPENEWKKRYTRVARKYPPPKFAAPRLDEFLQYLEEDEADDMGISVLFDF